LRGGIAPRSAGEIFSSVSALAGTLPRAIAAAPATIAAPNTERRSGFRERLHQASFREFATAIGKLNDETASQPFRSFLYTC